MLGSSKVKIFDDTGKIIALVHELDIRFNSKNELVEALLERKRLPDTMEGYGEDPYEIIKWWVKEIVTKGGFLEIHLIPQ